MRKIDFLVISDEKEILRHCQETAAESGFSFRSTPNVDVFAEQEVELKNSTLILISAQNVKVDTEIAGMVQVVKHIAPEAYLVVSIDSRLDSEVAIFIKKSGASLVLMGSDILTTSKLQYVASQKILSSYLPIRIDELNPNTTINCTIYHSMPLNKKFLPVLNAGITITEERLTKLREITFVYIKHTDIDQFKKYCEQHQTQPSPPASGAVRAQFLSLANIYADLIFLIIDQSERVSYSAGHQLYEQCENLCHSLMATIENRHHPWEIIQESATGSPGGLERSAVIAAYAGLLSLKSKVGNHLKTMTAGLLANIGFLEFSHSLCSKVRNQLPPKNWSTEDLQIYHHHPTISLNIALGRKFQVPEDVKEIILCSHETVDRQGFPHQPRPEKIPLESLILQAAEKLDQLTYTQMGKAPPDMTKAKQLLFEKELSRSASANCLFVEKLKTALL